MRLPSVLAAVLATLAGAWAALRAYGAGAARLALLMLPVTVGMIGLSHSAAFDMLFAAFLTAAAAAGAEILQKQRAGVSWMLAFGFMLGFATLAKGPSPVLLAGGATLLWGLASRQIAAAFRFFHPACVAGFAVTAVPWYALCAARNPDFLRVFLFEHNVERYLTPLFQHSQPLWFFIPVLLLAIFPWTALLVPLFLDAFQARDSGQWRNSPTLYFACWAATPVAFFTFSESKLPGYILPSVPPLVLILSATLARRLSGKDRSPWIWPASVACSLPLLSLSAGYWVQQLPADSGMATANAWTGWLALAAGGGLLCAGLAWARKEQSAVTGVAILTSALVVAAAVSALPGLRSLSFGTRRRTRYSGRARLCWARFCLRRGSLISRLGLEYYLDRPVPPLGSPAPVPVSIWTTSALATNLLHQGYRYTVIRRLSNAAWLLRIEQAPGA